VVARAGVWGLGGVWDQGANMTDPFEVPTFHVRDFGAIGDGQADDTEAIQQAIDAAGQKLGSSGAPEDARGKGAIVALHPGLYRVTSELAIVGQAAIHLRGAGAHGFGKLQHTHVGPRVSLIWDPVNSPAQPALLRLHGCAGITISDITLYGAESGRGDVALIRLKLLDTRENLLHTFRNVGLANASVGIESGTSDGRILMERVTMDNLAAGLKVLGESGVQYVWENGQAMNCTTVVDFVEGGCLDAHVLVLVACGGEGSDEWCLKFGAGGANVRCSRLTLLKVENQTKQIMRILGDHRVVLDSYIENEGVVGKFHVDGGALVMHGGSVMTKPLLTWAATARRTHGPLSG
jgi:hypothetical protein